jgi:tetratricopeptide (TPR) repeat protein
MSEEHIKNALSYEKEDKLHFAIRELQMAIDLEPNNAIAYCNLARVCEKKGQLVFSIEMYKRAIDLMPESAEGYFHLALVYLKLKQYDDALKNFKMTKKFDTDGLYSHYYDLANKEQYEEIIKSYVLE